MKYKSLNQLASIALLTLVFGLHLETSAKAQVSLEQLCSTFPDNSRCQRIEQGLPAVETGISIPSDNSCQPLSVMGNGTTFVQKTSEFTSPAPLRWIGIRDNNLTQFSVPNGEQFTSYIGLILSESLVASYTIEISLEYSNGSADRVFSVYSLPMSEQHRHGFEGKVPIDQSVSSVKVVVSRPASSTSGRYQLSLFGCK